VHEEVAVVGQNPFALFVAFEARRQLAAALQLQTDLIADRLILFRIQTRADNEVVSEAGDAGQIQNPDVFGLFCLRGADGNLPSLFILSLGYGVLWVTFRSPGFGVLQRFASLFLTAHNRPAHWRSRLDHLILNKADRASSLVVWPVRSVVIVL